jgi:rhodanese-related sulfurtransferase
MSVATISPNGLARRRAEEKNLKLIDVRTPAEFQEVHVDFAQNIPLDQLDPAAVIASRTGAGAEALYLICQAGGRSAKACEKFQQAGFTNVVSVEGGTQAWDQAGLPVVRGQKTMSLERQVRITAGSIVLVGVILGFLVHPAFFGLSGFIGAGLVFAGVTDTCGMGMMLARMPWNQRSGGAACSISRPTPAA